MKIEKVGQRIKNLIKKRELTVEQLASQTGLSKDFIVSVQEDDIYPSLGPLLKIARALGVRLGTFLDDQIFDLFFQ